jgi:hypothetical protein
MRRPIAALTPCTLCQPRPFVVAEMQTGEHLLLRCNSVEAERARLESALAHLNLSLTLPLCLGFTEHLPPSQQRRVLTAVGAFIEAIGRHARLL